MAWGNCIKWGSSRPNGALDVALSKSLHAVISSCPAVGSGLTAGISTLSTTASFASPHSDMKFFRDSIAAKCTLAVQQYCQVAILSPKRRLFNNLHAAFLIGIPLALLCKKKFAFPINWNWGWRDDIDRNSGTRNAYASFPTFEIGNEKWSNRGIRVDRWDRSIRYIAAHTFFVFNFTFWTKL